MKNHGFLHKTKRQHKIKAKNVLSSRKNEVFVVLNNKEPEWMSTEDVDIPPLDSYEVIEKDQVLPVYVWWKLFNAMGIIFREFREKNKKNNEPEPWKSIKNREENKYFVYAKLAHEKQR